MNNKNIDYKQKYKELKGKLKSLIYENETYHEQLRRSQDEYLQVTKDRDYLLNRLLAYENISDDSTDCSCESDTEIEKIASRNEMNSTKKKKITEPKKRAVKLSVKRGRPNAVQSQKPDQQKPAVKQTKGQSTVKAVKVSAERKNSTVGQATEEVNPFDQFEPANRLGSLVSGTLNEYPTDFEREPDKLMFAHDDQKLLFNNDGNLSMLPDSSGAPIDPIDLELNLNNLHANLGASGLTHSLAGSEIDDALANNLNGDLNENGLRSGGLGDGLTCLNTDSNNLASLDGNLNFENINFESQSSQSLLIKQ